MRITIISITNKVHGPVRELTEQYQKRLKNWQLEWKLISPPAGEPEVAKLREAELIMKAIPAQAYVILLDERGTQLDSPGLSRAIEKWGLGGSQLVFIIGGAFGVSDIVRKRADFIWSLSPLVLPHQLVQVILTEQLYRAQMIIVGHPYHHS